ncbi:16S rRNA (cytosine(1402)-N(4))-methyltransferase RsmH [Enterobacteriaceae endosymbiont of Donacia tomentosa]|uniref:16S rRNA (cytosine(1402)-N(4))-methyltransferase RsmH n=1 Tax=Enterobacteriaceae endosymbiont of Donacia tomentosa TaxID=2675787 RepID=UPI0014497A81|nr:16S rRNA (cytosine(1402)-N(4))-methyltransferase RsmH [Enterobacteriaceae endosymbiont of Donacia tomentosa]QJC31584.1 16S rRNA (cytosine(1402)-N(4))-methyltransferase RsmH [Enterobacteriaceae endosymbiont of Donacia tomentosa]
MNHIPVLLKESIKNLNIKNNGTYIDATYGCGGHTKLILSKLNNDGRIFAIDCDNQTIIMNKIIDKRIFYINEKFSNLEYIINKKFIGKIDGILFDLGISSFQLNNPLRGFSFMNNGPLDMRMNQNSKLTAYDLLKITSEIKLSCILKKYGEEKFHKKIAFNIKKYILNNKLSSTQDLSNLICSIIPKKNRFKHPATRSFQAIRIFLNKELDELKTALHVSLKLLKKGGILCVISFHSLEDRIVKHFIKKYSSYNIYSNLPLTETEINNLYYINNKFRLKIVNRIFPSQKEIFNNPRSRSAILRVAKKI